ncbi:hypothetical protein Fmac_010480 [Flemingia macrophylla]|uniref:Transmembrane protein n=1 Tax=Flemingia macrophylla TaxID=520843 RepID=A0ABD1MJU7_9FABA
MANKSSYKNPRPYSLISIQLYTLFSYSIYLSFLVSRAVVKISTCFKSMADFVLRPRSAYFESAFRGTHVTFNILYVQARNLAEETDPLHALVSFIFLVLLGFLQMKYRESPTAFQLHPKTLMVSIASFLLYCFGFLGRLRFATWVHHFETLMHVFASLSLVSLVVLLLPETWESFGFIFYTLWFIALVFTIIRSRSLYREIRVQVQRQQMRLPVTSMDLN